MTDSNASYEINTLIAPKGTKCNCGHSIEVHGSNGKICAACPCKVFVEAFDPKRPMEAMIQ